MQYIDITFILNRLKDSPIMNNLKLTSLASYVKDFSSINKVGPIIGEVFTYTRILDYVAILPDTAEDIIDVYLCGGDFNELFSENDRLSASLKTSKIGLADKVIYGTYRRKGNNIFTDLPEGVLEVYHKVLQVDEMGFPILPYDGSLMEALINYVKYRYFTILWENDLCARNKVDSAHRDYAWYIGQYTSKVTIPTYDEAVSWANSWQRLLNTRNKDLDDKPFNQSLRI